MDIVIRKQIHFIIECPSNMRNLILLLNLFFIFCSFSGKNHLCYPVRPGKDIALFFAVNNYTAWDKLKNPISEAEAIAKELHDHYDFATEVVKDPTKAEIQAKIEEYRNRAYATDAQLFIFFTGHGEYIESTREGFFIPKDAKRNDPSQDSYLPYLRLQRWIETLPCRHILLAIDACYSGTFSDDIALKGEPGKRPGQSDRREQFIQNSLEYRSRIFMASGAKVRTPDQSAFATQFLAALRSFGGDDRLINITELWSYVQRAKPDPCMAKFGGGDSGHEPGGDFLFVLETAKEPTPPVDPDQATWNSVQKQNTPDAYAYYLEAYPNGRYQAQALDERAWLLAARQNTSAAYQVYLDTYTDGRHRAEAEAKTAQRSGLRTIPDTVIVISCSSNPTDLNIGATYLAAQTQLKKLKTSHFVLMNTSLIGSRFTPDALQTMVNGLKNSGPNTRAIFHFFDHGQNNGDVIPALVSSTIMTKGAQPSLINLQKVVIDPLIGTNLGFY